MPAIALRQLTYAYPPLLADAPSVQVLRGVDLTVARGEFLALMGPTGVGKTTLCMALNGLVPRATGGVIGGSVQVLGLDPRNTPVAEMARRVSIVYQDPDSQLFCANVEDEVAFGPEGLALPRAEIADRVAWALALVDMSEHRLRSPNALSGGQKQRVAIAAGLAMLPELLVLDEPTSGLDPQGQYEVWSAIERLRREHKMTIVMVSQDAEQVAEFAERVAVLYEGRLLAVDAPERVFADRDLLRTAGLAAPQVSEVAQALNARCGTHYAFTRLDEAEAELRGQRTPSVLPAALPPPSPADDARDAPAAPALIRVEGLHYHYDDETPALNGVDLTLPDNAFLAIIGQNGSGKTTLVKHLNGLLRPIAGDVWVDGVNTRAATVGQLARTVGYVFQNPDHQIFCATTREELAFGPRNLGLPGDEVHSRAEEALAAFGLTPYAEMPPAVLGYGLRRKVGIAAVYAMRPRVFILDEPTAGLDWRSAQEVMAHLRALWQQGHTIILVSHDMRLVAEHAAQTLVMEQGRVLASGPTHAVLAQDDVLRQAQIRPPQVRQLALRLRDLGVSPETLSVEAFADAWCLRREARP